MTSLIELARSQIENFAKEHGFHSVRFARSLDAERFPEFCDWLERGYNASMGYLKKRQEAYRNPEGVLENCQSLILLTLPYQAHPWTQRVIKQGRKRFVPSPLTPTIGSYAMPRQDYHIWIRRKLKPLVKELQRMFPDCHSRVVVDTAPLLERDYASRAGLGWIGKNTMLLNREIGSYFLLSAILTQAKLIDHETQNGSDSTSHCGTCRACLDSCPTQAFVEPYVLDANRCISYWTIEHRGEIPEAMRVQMGPWLFGCDICQIVCPWNQKTSSSDCQDMKHDSIVRKSDCMHWLELDQASFDALYKDTPFARSGLIGMQRNAIIVAANLGIESALPAIRRVATQANHPLEQTALWALGQLEFPTKTLR
ncbi:MAG: tRNA epoxyqueuosine(34) reductase QueG [Planctomycetota bacterium]|jgi:epoxyqueuosine reductase